MARKPHVLIFPFPAQGHMIPLLDLTHTLACHGLFLTVLTTPQNQPLLESLLHKASAEGLHIQPLIIPLPPTEGLPPGCENMAQVLPRLIPLFMYSFKELDHPIEDWFQQQKSSDGFGPPVCMISDFFLGWTHDTAAKLGIPRIVFYPSSAFTISLSHSLWKFMPELLESEDDIIHFPELPHPTSFPRCRISYFAQNYKKSDPVYEFLRYIFNLNVKSWGSLINTFYDLEAVYIDHLHRVVSGRHVWSVGPLLPPASFKARQRRNNIERGKPPSIDDSVCVQWLDSRKEKSVIYICFGSQACLSNKQTQEMAAGLEASEESFIWVFRDPPSSMPADEYGVLPQGSEERLQGRGLIIRGWAPQLLILSHPSVGGFLTHCGWNSTLESIALGVPLITWPMTADQNYNARLLVEYLKVGVRFCEGATTVPNRDDLRIAVKRLLAREGEEMKRAEELSKAARTAVQEGGTSYRNIEACAFFACGFSKEIGVTEFINPLDYKKPIQEVGDYKKPIQEVIAEKIDGRVDYSIECTGNVKAMIQAFESCHDGWGVVVLVGVPHSDAVFATSPLNFLNETTLKGTFFGNYKPHSNLPGPVELYLDKKLELEKFITHEVSFADINKAFDYMIKAESLRCAINVIDN